jgi:hypothetical protein
VETLHGLPQPQNTTELPLRDVRPLPLSGPSPEVQARPHGMPCPRRTDKRKERVVRYLTPDEYSLWDKLVSASPQGTIFCRSWWLSAISGDVRLLGYFGDRHLIAGIPLYFEKRFGVDLCTIPPLTQTWGVMIEPLVGKEVSKASRELEILRAIASSLSEQSIFFQAFHPSFRNWLPLQWRGFKQTTRFTYVLDDLSSADAIWKGMRHQMRTEIRKAERLGLTITTCDIATVFRTGQELYRRRGVKQPFTLEYLRRIYAAARQHNAAECFAAQDRTGRIHAANLLVWDSKKSYYLAGARDSESFTTGAQALLIWHMIQFAATRTRAFDFEGSVLAGVERFFRGFGAKRIPYSLIMKFPLWLRLYLILIRKI